MIKWLLNLPGYLMNNTSCRYWQLAWQNRGEPKVSEFYMKKHCQEMFKLWEHKRNQSPYIKPLYKGQKNFLGLEFEGEFKCR